MNIEIITDRGVLVELSFEDLQQMNLTYESIGTDENNTKKAWKSILCEIESRTGRLYSGREVEIDMLPSRAGGCLLIVSGNGQGHNKANQLCLFSTADAFLDCLTSLRAGGFFQKAKAFRMPNGTYAVLKKADAPEMNALREFGTVISLTKHQLDAVMEESIPLKISGGA